MKRYLLLTLIAGCLLWQPLYAEPMQPGCVGLPAIQEKGIVGDDQQPTPAKPVAVLTGPDSVAMGQIAELRTTGSQGSSFVWRLDPAAAQECLLQLRTDDATGEKVANFKPKSPGLVIVIFTAVGNGTIDEAVFRLVVTGEAPKPPDAKPEPKPQPKPDNGGEAQAKVGIGNMLVVCVLSSLYAQTPVQGQIATDARSASSPLGKLLAEKKATLHYFDPVSCPTVDQAYLAAAQRNGLPQVLVVDRNTKTVVAGAALTNSAAVAALVNQWSE